MSRRTPALVTLHVWRVPAYAVPATLVRVARDHLTVRRTPGMSFAKLLGTGDGRTFTVRDATLRRWALLSVWDSADCADAFEHSATVRRWDATADERWRVLLEPLAARGRWSRREPFGRPEPRRHDGAVAALTRARIAPTKLTTFWRAVPPVSADVHRSDGLLLTLGIGEAPIGLQGTFSVWRRAADLAAYAYQGAPHLEAIRRTAEERWYTEELFARFAVVGATGSVDDADPLAGVDL